VKVNLTAIFLIALGLDWVVGELLLKAVVTYLVIDTVSTST